MAENTAWLHFRPQAFNHCPVEIVGTAEGLEALGVAVAEAIQCKSASATVFANDGEGYRVEIRRSSTVSGLGQPFYLSDVMDAAERAKTSFATQHHRLMARQNQEALEALRWCRANGNPHRKRSA